MVETVISETVFGHLPSVGLNHLEHATAWRKRFDHKYFVATNVVIDLVESLDRSTRVLEVDGSQSLDYQTVYFDTPCFDMYLAAARSRPRRCKVRTRSYLTTGTAFLEVKSRNRAGFTLKHRLPYLPELSHELTRDGRSFLEAFELVSSLVDELQPTLVVSYTRTTLLEPDTMSRITIDTQVRAETPEGRQVEVREDALVETKTTVPPTSVDRMLWSRHQRPTSFSKYCTLMAATHPTLPANKWNRTLRNRFGWQPQEIDRDSDGLRLWSAESPAAVGVLDSSKL